MPLELVLQKETKGLTDEALMEVIRYVRFMKIEAGNSAKFTLSEATKPSGKTIRRAGKYKGQGWMAEDFDEPLDDFKEYM